MRPGLPHAVVSPEPALCKGGHFYCTTTIQNSIVGIFHDFVGKRTVTNTEHQDASNLLLTSILTYYVLDLVNPSDCKCLIDIDYKAMPIRRFQFLSRLICQIL